MLPELPLACGDGARRGQARQLCALEHGDISSMDVFCWSLCFRWWGRLVTSPEHCPVQLFVLYYSLRSPLNHKISSPFFFKRRSKLNRVNKIVNFYNIISPTIFSRCTSFTQLDNESSSSSFSSLPKTSIWNGESAVSRSMKSDMSP